MTSPGSAPVRAAHALGFSKGAVSIDGLGIAPFDADHAVPLAQLLARVAPLFAREREGVVLVDQEHADALQLGDRAPANLKRAVDHPAALNARAAGWSVSRIGPWSTFYADGRPSVHLCVVPWLAEEDAGPLFGALFAAGERYDRDPVELAYHLARFHVLTGGSWSGNPGTTGVGLLREKLRPRRAPRWQPEGVRKWHEPTMDAEHDVINWARTGAEADGEREHRYDANMAYLGAAALVTVASDDLTRGERARFDKGRAGYWRIRRPAWNEPRMPSPLGFRNDPGAKTVWVTTPTLQLLVDLAEQGYTDAPDVLDSWTAPAVRLLRPWAEKLHGAMIDARVSGEPDDQLQVRAIQAVYQRTIGMLGHEGSRVYRPDWRHTVIGLARANLWRKVHRVGLTEGRWPSAWHVDAVSYRSPNPEPVAACPSGINLGAGLGSFKIEESR